MPPNRGTLLLLSVFVVIFLLTLLRTIAPIFTENSPGNAYEPVALEEVIRTTTTFTLTESVILGAAAFPGFTLFDRLYLRNGTFYVVSSDVSSLPPKRNVLAPPVVVGEGQNVKPTDQELQYINSKEMEEILGDHPIRIEGFSMILYDTGQFMDHFHHWWGEIILGSWRVYSAFIYSINASWPPPFPARFILPRIYGDEWRDRAGLNGPLMRACFASASIEKRGYWLDLIALNKTVVFERAMIVSREAARKHPFSGNTTMVSAMHVPTLDNFWEHIRSTTITNLLGYLPIPVVDDDKPIVTYISRRGAGRRLSDDDHRLLVDSLLQLEEEGICEVVVAVMEHMSLHDQIDLASRSSIIVGLHGDGLTHQLWMPPSHRSTVIEIFNPNGYVFDYELLTRNLGHRHYAMWNDTVVTYLKGIYDKGIPYGDGFPGNSIPVYGPAVARIIRARLTESITS